LPGLESGFSAKPHLSVSKQPSFTRLFLKMAFIRLPEIISEANQPYFMVIDFG
jgi:hypothetical protein